MDPVSSDFPQSPRIFRHSLTQRSIEESSIVSITVLEWWTVEEPVATPTGSFDLFGAHSSYSPQILIHTCAVLRARAVPVPASLWVGFPSQIAGRAVRIIINPADCDGFGFCAQIVPEVLSLDEWGFPVVREDEVPESLVRAARQAVHLCPRKALSLLESRNTDSRTRVTLR